MSIFKGAGVAIVTPFKDDKVDYEAFDKLLDFQLNNGTDAIIVCGTTGEASTMEEEEKLDLIKHTVEKVNKRVPVIAGTGSNSTNAAIKFSKKVEKLGVDALLIVTPYYNKTTQEGAYEHYKTIALNVSLPIIMYNVPSRTGFNLKPNTVKRLSEIPNIVGIKEASGDISQVSEIASICDIDIYSGCDDIVVPILSVGGIGVISVVSNIMPKETHDMVIKYLEGKVNEAKEIQLKLFRLIKLLFIEVNPIPVKAALNYLGIINDELRLPLIKMSEENRKLLFDEMKKLGLL